MKKELDRRDFLLASAASAFATVISPQLALAAKTQAFDWDKKVVLITGGTSGLGKKMALSFAAKGAKVAFCGRRQEKGELAQKEIKKNGGHGIFIRADITKEDEVKNFVHKTQSELGPIHLAVNNAGIHFDSMTFAQDPLENHANIINTNLIGTMNCLKYEIAHMLKQKYGNIINIGSVAAVRGSVNGASYSASKHGVLGLTRSLAKLYAPQGIRINMISPYGMNHEMDGTDNLTDENSKEIRAVIANTPTGKLTTMDEVIDNVFWVGAQNVSSYTGQNLLLDGGALS